ncbi:lipopolysaccharide biosynthesis protein [Rhodopirellula sp. JC639]|uniref:lipopolysaccharide biosynthesis protein n=1 Tax=Stieleria mannarensis TaxID=2755585 RepID=UPI00160388CD|nr:oligosaccharide flippase family protein [Rhodopirellula sp. JC639]
MSSGRRNAKNLAINYSSFIATGMVMLMLSPFVIRSLGPVAYGIWSLLNMLIGYMGILDLGVRGSTGRHITLYLGREDSVAIDQTVRTSLACYTLLGLVIFIVAGVLGGVFPHVFPSVPAEYRPALLVLVPLMAVNIWTSAVAAVFASVLRAHERFDLACAVDLSTLAVRTVGTVLVLQAGHGMVGLAITVVASNFIPLFANAWLAKRIYSPLRFWPLEINRERMRELGTFAVGTFVTTVALKVINQTDLVIVGFTFDVATVTVFSVGAMLVNYSNNLTSLIYTTFRPSLQKAVARNEMGAARWIFFRQVRLANLIGIPVYVGFTLYGVHFIRLWMMGPGFDALSVQSAATVMGILASARLLNLFSSGFTSLLWAMGDVRFNATLALTQSLTNLLLSLLFVLALGWGLWGIAFGTFVSGLVVPTFALPWYACRKAKINLWTYTIQIGGRVLVSAGLFGCWCYLAQQILPCNSWTTFFGSVALALIGYVPIALWLLVPEADRSRVQSKIRALTAIG